MNNYLTDTSCGYCSNQAIVIRNKSRRELLEYCSDCKPIFDKMSLYIGSAKKRDIEFSLSESEFVSLCTKPCHYCGCTGISGVDRVDSLGKYEMSNCVPACGRCNKMKLNYSVKEFIEHCRKIVSFHE